MITVANHLRDYACGLNDDPQVDLFGRSAFNRFYYACYWEIRTKLPNIVSDWTKLGHKALPERLEKSVKRDTLGTLEKLRRKRVISDADFGRLSPRITTSIVEIASVMRRGYSVRCTADYAPDLKASKAGGSLTLDGAKLSTFESAYRDLAIQVGILKKSREEIGL